MQNVKNEQKLEISEDELKNAAPRKEENLQEKIDIKEKIEKFLKD